MKEVKIVLFCLLSVVLTACGNQPPQPADTPTMASQNNTSAQTGNLAPVPIEEKTQPPDEKISQDIEINTETAETGTTAKKLPIEQTADMTTVENNEEIKSVQVLNYLENPPGNGTDISKGAGVFICPDILVTAFHVVDEFVGPVRDRLFFEDPYTYENIPLTTIVGLSEKYDLAALRAEGYEPENCYSVDDSPEIDVNVSERVTLYGFDRDYHPAEISGRIEEEVFYRNESFRLVRTQIYNGHLSGMSGAPVLSESNQLMGIVSRDFKMDVLFVNRLRLKDFLAQEEMTCTSHQCIYEENKRLQSQAEAEDGIAQLQMGFREYRTGRFPEAFKWYEKAVHYKIPVAYYNMGFMYEKGYGVPQDGKRAILWFKEAADRGLILAEYIMGLMYYRGRLIRQNFTLAGHHFLNAGNKRYPLAEYAMGDMLANGYGFKKNMETAKNFFKRSARQGYPPAIKKLRELGK